MIRPSERLHAWIKRRALARRQWKQIKAIWERLSEAEQAMFADEIERSAAENRHRRSQQTVSLSERIIRTIKRIDAERRPDR